MFLWETIRTGTDTLTLNVGVRNPLPPNSPKYLSKLLVTSRCTFTHNISDNSANGARVRSGDQYLFPGLPGGQSLGVALDLV